MIRTLGRVFAGFLLACLTAGLVQVLFVVTPPKLLGSPANLFAERAAQTGVIALLAATHAAIFSAAFTLIATGIGEWMRIRALGFYLFAGMAIALLGFFAQYSSEVAGQPTIFNNYAVLAYLTSGFFAGLMYWLVAGRRAGGPDDDEQPGDNDTADAPQPAKSWKTRPRLVVEDYPKPGNAAAKKATLAERLADTADAADTTAKVKAPDAKPQGQATVAAPAPSAAPKPVVQPATDTHSAKGIAAAHAGSTVTRPATTDPVKKG